MSRRAWGAFAAASLIWGVPYLFIRIAVRGGITPLMLAWGRVTLAAVVLLLLAWKAGVLGPIRRHLRWLGLYAFVEVTIPFPLIAFGEQRVSSSLAAIVVASVPLVGAVLAIRFDHTERPTRLRALGLLIGFSGVIALVGIDVAGRASELLGAAAILIAAIGYAIGPMIVKLRLGALDPRAAMGGMLAIASVLLLPGAVLDLPSRVPTAGAIACVIVLGLVCTAAAFVILTILIREAGTSRAMVITYVNPVVAVALGVVLLGEQPGAGAIAGLLLILAGSWLSTGGRLPPMLRRSAVTVGAVLALLAFAGAAGAATTPAWTTYRHDMQRSGIDPDPGSPVPPTKVWQTDALDGPIYGSPLVYGTRVYVATENDTVYALDFVTGAIVWQTHVATAVPSDQLPCGGIEPTVGITSTPVIDPATQRVYVVADTWDGTHPSTIQHKLDGLNLATGTTTSSETVDPGGSHPEYQLQRPALALSAGRIMIGYGGNDGDCGEDEGLYHGWVVSVPEGGGTMSTFEVAPSTGGGAVWGSGNGLAVDAAGRVWINTGNSPGPPFEKQESVVKLDPATMTALDWWAPTNWAELDSGDVDLGSTEPLLLPNGLVFTIGKEGVGYLLNASKLGHEGATPLARVDVCGGSFGGGIVVGGVIYVTCSDGMHALSVDTAAKTLSARGGWHITNGANGPPIYAGGLVWSAGWHNGILYGLDPSTGNVSFSANLGSFDHFATPAAGGGRLFVANDRSVTALRISAPAPPPPPPPPPLTRPAISKIRLSGSGATRTLQLTLSRAATVTFALTQRVAGRISHGRCRTRVRVGRRCTLTVRRARFTLHGHGGVNAFRLRLRRLKAGRYTVSIVATDTAGLRSKTSRLTLTVK